MTTPYCDKDQWSKWWGYLDWATFDAAKNWPTEIMLDEALEAATIIMNDTEHIGSLATNITDTNYTERLKRINFNMANRMMNVQNVMGQQAGNLGLQNWSQADYLMSYERNYLVNLGIIKKYRQAMGFGIG